MLRSAKLRKKLVAQHFFHLVMNGLALYFPITKIYVFPSIQKHIPIENICANLIMVNNNKFILTSKILLPFIVMN